MDRRTARGPTTGRGAAPDRGEPTDADAPVVLFDMDGVIVEGRGTADAVHDRALDDVLAARELDPDDDVRSALSGYEYTDTFVGAAEALGVDPADLFAERERRSARRSNERLAAGARGVYPDVDALDRIADHATVGLVSNNYHPTVEFVVDHFGLDAFALARGRDLGVEGFRRRKPEPYYLNEALSALGASDGLYVGDRRMDLLAAERAGLDGVFLRRDHNAGKDLDVPCTAEVGSLTALIPLVADG
ncbi:HAD family hydrolase [Halobacteriales archaeon QS_6_71_20]|nr:MAG: HAD family hydrolase [Halobacteriales archaeon QS_6_71_20]